MIKLDPWQIEALQHKGDLLLCTGRRVGKTYIMAVKAVEAMINDHKNIIVVSITEDQAELIIQMALLYARDKYPGLIGKKARKPTRKKLVIGNNYMLARPVGATGNSMRGFEGGILIVDEAARMPRFFWIAAKPIILTTGGHIWMASTPHGKQGYFWEMFDAAYNKHKPEARFKVIYTSTEKVIQYREISNDWTQEQKEAAIKILAQDKEEMSNLEYGQEYMGLFIEDLMQFFPDELIEKCCILKEKERFFEGKPYYLGVDIARMGEDDSTFEVVRRTNNNELIHVESIVTSKTSLRQTTEQILMLDFKFHFRRIFVDDAGVGAGVFENLLESPVKRKVIAINNARRSLDRDEKEKKRLMKPDLYHNLKRLMESGKIKLLKDMDVYNSLKSVMYEYAQSQKGESFIKIYGRDTHITEGLIRAAWCVKQKGLNIWLSSFKP